MKLIRVIILSILLSLAATHASAQYFSGGIDPYNLKWNSIKTDKYNLVFPDFYAPAAQQLSVLYDSIYYKGAYGLPLPSRPIPVVLHTQNLISNGLVSWAPKRIELYTNYEPNQFATPWMRQLLVHEYRHAVQISSMRQGLSKVVSYILGEQGLALCLLVLPKWFMEGDATVAETEMTTYGRGVQPSFTLEYRAYLAEDKRGFTQDKWVCGSYKDYIPDIYQYGYQIISGSRTLYGDDFWNNVMNYAARYPILVSPTYFAYKKYGNTSSEKMFAEVFSRLKTTWDSLYPRQNSFRFLQTTSDGWTRYRYPMPSSGGRVVSLKSDFDRVARFTEIDPQTSAEEVLAYAPRLSSRPVTEGDKIYWTEYRPHAVWTQKNYSVVRMLDRTSGRAKYLTHGTKEYFITPLYGEMFATVALDSLGNSFVNIKNVDMRTVKQHRFDGNISISGMAWDSKTKTLSVIALTDEGMWLGTVDTDNGKLEKLSKPSYVTIQNLSAADGRLYFNSTESGIDEVNYFDIASGKEFRVTTSIYGSYEPTTVSSDSLLLSSYTRNGYRIGTTATDSAKQVGYRYIPENLVNMQRRPWNVLNVDTLDLTIGSTAAEAKPVKKYRKSAHIFNFHSWVPISFDPIASVEEFKPNLHLGVTALSQNTLSSTEMFATYGYDLAEKANFVGGQFVYYGLGPRISVASTYMWGGRMVYLPRDTDIDNVEDLPSEGDYFSLTGEISLPLNLSSGNNNRALTPSFEITHYNSLIYQPSTDSFKKSFQTYQGSLSFANNLAMARKDINPRLGYALKAGIEGAMQREFSTMYTAYGRAYLPGVAMHHSLTLKGAYQYQTGARFGMTGKELYPRGSEHRYTQRNYYAGSANYTLPIWYPDGGWNSWIYFQRLRINAFYDYSFATGTGFGSGRYNVSSYGLDLGIDCNPLRATSIFLIDLTIAFPSDKSTPYFGAGMKIPF